MTLSDLIQYVVIAAVAGFSLWRLARPYIRRPQVTAKTSAVSNGCGTGEGCGSCGGCSALKALSPHNLQS